MLKIVCSAAVLLGTAIVAGCGPSGPIMVPVSGTVTLDGKPLDDGTIYFKTIMEGSIDRMDVKEGKFAGQVEIGDRRVEVCRFRSSKLTKVGNDVFPNTVNTIPARYNAKSELTAKVSESGPNEFTFDVKSK